MIGFFFTPSPVVMILISFFILLNHVFAASVPNRTDRLLDIRNDLKQKTKFTGKTDISVPSPWILSNDLGLYILGFLDDDLLDFSATCKNFHQISTRYIETKLPAHLITANPFLSKLFHVISTAKGKLYFLHPFLNIIVSDHLSLCSMERPACLSNPVEVQFNNLVNRCTNDPTAYKLVQVLLEKDGHRISANILDYAVDTALINRHIDSFKYFLSLNNYACYPSGLLITAVIHSNSEALQHLLAGNISDFDDLLLEAIHFHKNDLIPLLLAKIENTQNIRLSTFLIDLPVKALSHAISRQNPLAIRLLLTFPYFQYDRAPLEASLMAAVQISNPEILRELINNARFSYEALEAALDLAVLEMNRNAVTVLLDEVDYTKQKLILLKLSTFITGNIMIHNAIKVFK